MDRRLLIFISLALLSLGLVPASLALEKVKLGTSVKVSPAFYLPVLAAEEKGFWKDNGLDVEWVPFGGGPPLMRAVAAGAINNGLSPTDTPMVGAERGLPLVMVAELLPSYPFLIWVRTESPYKHPRDLKGAKVGVPAMGGMAHIYARMMLAAHGMEKDVRYMATGGVVEQMAGMRVGAFEAMSLPLPTIAPLKAEGIVREVASSADYVPQPWLEYTVFARKDFGRSKPDVLRKMIKAILQSLESIRKEPRWTIDKIKSFQGVSEEAAKLVYDSTRFTTTGKLERKAVENVRKTYIEYGIITEKAPAVDDLFTNEYLS